MDERYDELSEKEKEALRLMVRGHDAKSMARELSLSVHTINDRLRAARRKLGVTSSREAARLVLEQESDAPQILADKQLGGAAAPGPAEKGMASMGMRPGRKFILIGVILMSTLIVTILLIAQASAPQAPAASSQRVAEAPTAPVAASDAIAEQSARQWLSLVDRGDWEASFDATGRTFKQSNTLSGWTDAAKQVRGPQGAFVSRQLLTVRALGNTPVDYREVVFATRYANAEVVETITLQEEEGDWKIVGIMVD